MVKWDDAWVPVDPWDGRWNRAFGILYQDDPYHDDFP